MSCPPFVPSYCAGPCAICALVEEGVKMISFAMGKLTCAIHYKRPPYYDAEWVCIHTMQQLCAKCRLLKQPPIYAHPKRLLRPGTEPSPKRMPVWKSDALI